jgi:hypothetical protein
LTFNGDNKSDAFALANRLRAIDNGPGKREKQGDKPLPSLPEAINLET